MFIGVGYGLPTALPHASPRLKLLMAPHWCCRVNPPPSTGYPGGRYPGKTRVLEKSGVKLQGELGEVQMKIEVRNEDWPPGCISQRLTIGTPSCCGDRNCCPINPPAGRYPGKAFVLEIPGGKCVCRRG